MSDLISRKYLYEKMMEKEELARQRVLDTPTHSPAYLRYVAQLNERTALKHEIADAPTVEAVPVGECVWIKSDAYPFNWHIGCDGCEITHKQGDFCPKCGKKIQAIYSDMGKKV